MTDRRAQLLLEWARQGGELEEWRSLVGPVPAPDERFRWSELRAAAALWMAERSLIDEVTAGEESLEGQALDAAHLRERAHLLAESSLHVFAACLGSEAWARALTGGEVSPWVAWRARARRELALLRATGRGTPRALLIPTLWTPELMHADCMPPLAEAAQAAHPSIGTGLALSWAGWLVDDPRALTLVEDTRAAVPAGAEVWRDRLERCRMATLARVGRLPAALASLEAWIDQHSGGDPVWPAWGLRLLGEVDDPVRAARVRSPWTDRAADVDPSLITWLERRRHSPLPERT